MLKEIQTVTNWDY